MMSHFRGSHTLIKMKFFNNFIALMISFLFLDIPVLMAAASAGEEMIINPLAELSSREELVNMAGYGEEKLSKVTVSGRVLCHACVLFDHHHHHHRDHKKAQPIPAADPISGASVAVFCRSRGNARRSWARSTTDEYGDFLIDLPSHLHAIPNLEIVCLLKVLHLPKNSDCRPGFTGKHKGIKLLSVQDGARTYTANKINLTPKPSKTCKTMARSRKEMIHVY